MKSCCLVVQKSPQATLSDHMTLLWLRDNCSKFLENDWNRQLPERLEIYKNDENDQKWCKVLEIWR